MARVVEFYIPANAGGKLTLADNSLRLSGKAQ